jgi:outer membrane immunogenic protein
MKKLLLASAAAVLSGNAFAADPSPMPAAWTACYIGAHAGAGALHTDFTDPNGSSIAPVGGSVHVNSDAGFIGGGQAGCDYQFAGHWVIGAVGDFSLTNIFGQSDDPFFAGKNLSNPLTVYSHNDFLGSAAGRVGYTFDRVLIYGKGGVAWSHGNDAVNNWACAIGTACYSNATVTRSGWIAGGGIELQLAPHWSALLEYEHYGFGTGTYTFVDVNHPGDLGVFGVKQNVDVVEAGLNYRFNIPFR